MKIAITGTRGIPNNYGGFEQFAEYLSTGLVRDGHDVTVYSPHFHPYRKDNFNSVKIKYVYSPEKLIGAALGNIIYDFLCLKDALKIKYDIIYEAGFTSMMPAYLFFNTKKIKYPIIVTNVDGLEWRRAKFNILTRIFMQWEEKLVSKYSHYIVADNKGIQQYFDDKYKLNSYFLAYGANIYSDYFEEYIKKYNLNVKAYHLIVARLEPENNIEIIINGYMSSNNHGYPLVIIGNTDTHYGKYLLKKFKLLKNIFFLGGIYNFQELNSFRHYSFSYFHGHSVGGTNPSLLEAMATGCFIIAHNNLFNKSVLDENALFFSNESDIVNILDSDVLEDSQIRHDYITNNLKKITEDYSWEKIIRQHVEFFKKIVMENGRRQAL
jgi:glycosyltransferase involved in cell wall biosynthesis